MNTHTQTASVSHDATGRRRWPGKYLDTAAPRLFAAFRPAAAPYGWSKILAGARRIEQKDPGWWGADARPTVDVGRLQAASRCSCVVAQRAGHGSLQQPGLTPFAAGLRRLEITPAEAPALGLAGPDADLFTAGWRLLITLLRGGATLDELAGLA